jgi:hypothetical protein
MPFTVRARDALIVPPALSPATPTLAVSLTPKEMIHKCIKIIQIKSDHKMFYFE